jgi:chorismate mutase/prephenate dehydratase
MTELEDARAKINEIDKNMAELFQRRMNLASRIADYKKKNGMQIFDSVREQQVIDRCVQFISESAMQPYYVEFLQHLMDVSKKYQHKLLEGTKIAYSGIEGAFANIAAKKIFPDGNLIPYANFHSAYESVENGECELAVLPIENSFAGEVGQVMDLMFTGKLYVNGIYALPVIQNLLCVKGAKIEDIKTVISHPQALDQCEDFIRRHGWKTEKSENTARAAKYVSELNDKSVAVIASEEAAALYALDVLQTGINNSALNATRFAVFSKVKENVILSENYSTFVMMFVVKNESGALVKALNVISEYGYSLRVIRSRPLKDTKWEYYFYAEAEGKFSGETGQKMIKALSEKCQMLKVLGSYNLTQIG